MKDPEETPLADIDAMILAAGLGTRMRPLTNMAPKPLLPVLGRSLLAWNLRGLAAQGTRRVVVNSHHLAAAMDSYVENELPREFADPEAPPKPEVTLVREMVLLGTGGGLGNAASLLRSDPVLVWNVDLLYRPDLRAARALHESENALATLVLTRSPLHAKIALEGNQVRSVAEDADPSDASLWAYTGVMFLSQEALSQLPAGQFDELPPRLRGWASEGRLFAFSESAPFLEVGTLASYLEVHRRLADSPELLPGSPPSRTLALDRFGYVDSAATIEGSPRMEDCLVLPGATVRADASIRRSILGPGAVAEGELFGKCLANGEMCTIGVLDRDSEEECLSFLDRHAKTWPKDARNGTRTLVPLHGDGSGRRLVRVIAGAHSRILVVPSQPEEAGEASHTAATAPSDSRSPASIPIYPQRSGEDIPDEPTTFVYVAAVLHQRGVRVPSILVHEEDSGLLLVEDLGDRTLHRVIQTASTEEVRDHYRKAVDLLVKMRQENDAAFDPDRVQSPSYSTKFALDFECGYFQREFVEGHLGLGEATTELRSEYEKIAARSAEGAESVLIHRDFQSRNLMVTARGLAVIDFQGARLGPPFYDLVSLVHDPYVELDDTLREELIRMFIERSRLDDDSRALVAPTAICRLLQALGAYGYLGGRLGKSGFLEYAPRALHRVVDLAGEEFPHLARLAKHLLELDDSDRDRETDGELANGDGELANGDGELANGDGELADGA